MILFIVSILSAKDTMRFVKLLEFMSKQTIIGVEENFRIGELMTYLQHEKAIDFRVQEVIYNGKCLEHYGFDTVFRDILVPSDKNSEHINLYVRNNLGAGPEELAILKEARIDVLMDILDLYWKNRRNESLLRDFDDLTRTISFHYERVGDHRGPIDFKQNARSYHPNNVILIPVTN